MLPKRPSARAALRSLTQTAKPSRSAISTDIKKYPFSRFGQSTAKSLFRAQKTTRRHSHTQLYHSEQLFTAPPEKLIPCCQGWIKCPTGTTIDQSAARRGLSRCGMEEIRGACGFYIQTGFENRAAQATRPFIRNTDFTFECQLVRWTPDRFRFRVPSGKSTCCGRRCPDCILLAATLPFGPVGFSQLPRIVDRYFNRVGNGVSQGTADFAQQAVQFLLQFQIGPDLRMFPHFGEELFCFILCPVIIRVKMAETLTFLKELLLPLKLPNQPLCLRIFLHLLF